MRHSMLEAESISFLKFFISVLIDRQSSYSSKLLQQINITCTRSDGADQNICITAN